MSARLDRLEKVYTRLNARLFGFSEASELVHRHAVFYSGTAQEYDQLELELEKDGQEEAEVAAGPVEAATGVKKEEGKKEDDGGVDDEEDEEEAEVAAEVEAAAEKVAAKKKVKKKGQAQPKKKKGNKAVAEKKEKKKNKDDKKKDVASEGGDTGAEDDDEEEQDEPVEHGDDSHDDVRGPGRPPIYDKTKGQCPECARRDVKLTKALGVFACDRCVRRFRRTVQRLPMKRCLNKCGLKTHCAYHRVLRKLALGYKLPKGKKNKRCPDCRAVPVTLYNSVGPFVCAGCIDRFRRAVQRMLPEACRKTTCGIRSEL
ncbi:unnamed protein product, partial [Mesorhabditis spiculigera]